MHSLAAEKPTYIMRKILSILCAGMIMIACTNNKQAINSKELKGRYEVDFSALMTGLGDDTDDLTTALAAMFLSAMEMTIQFEDTKMILDASGTAIGLVNAFSKEGLDMPIVADYKIANDSVLYVKSDGDDFERVGVLRKISDSYDYMQLVTDEDDGSKMILKLKKIQEK